MHLRLLHPLMVDGIDHPAGDLVLAPDQVAQEWITQRLAVPAAPSIETATPPIPANAAAPAQRRPPPRPKPHTTTT